jgi:hypothetical protein
LWRLIPAEPGSVPAAEMAAAPAEPAIVASATGPVLAMLSRLPFDLEDPA